MSGTRTQDWTPEQIATRDAKRAAAQKLLDAGFSLVVWRGRTKAPEGKNEKGWQLRTDTPDDITHDSQIGIKTGVPLTTNPKAYVVAVDYDCVEATIAREYLMPRTGRTHGRASKPAGQDWFLVERQTATKRWQGVPVPGSKKNTIIELRAASQERTPMQSMVPPSNHPDTAEPITWLADGEPLAMELDALTEAVRHVAIVCLLARAWPDSNRHNTELAIAGYLLRANVPLVVVCQMWKAINAIVNRDDPERDKWERDGLGAIRDTARRLENGDNVTGGGTLADFLTDGETVLKILRKWGVKAGYTGDAINLDYGREFEVLAPLCWQAIERANTPPKMFLRGVPVRLEYTQHKKHGQKFWTFVPLTTDIMRHVIARQLKFVETRKESIGPVPVPPPSDLCRDLRAYEPSAMPLPPINRLVFAPIVGEDGTIVTEEGYHEATGTYFVGGVTVPQIPERPTDDDMRQAKDALLRPLQDFPFVSDADQTHAIGALLLPFVRDLIDGPTPIHLIHKPTAGTGASLLVSALMSPALDRDIATISQQETDEAWEKLITSCLLDAPSAIIIDNVRALVSPMLAKATTDVTWKGRILGFSKTAELPVRNIWLATGNNPVLHSEIRRRVVDIRLDSGLERPELRSGFAIPDLRGYLTAHRAELIHAALTLVRAWFAKGCPKGARRLGMYESWSAVIGGILGTAGFEGFLANRDESGTSDDVERDVFCWFVASWWAKHKNMKVTSADLAKWALTPESPLHQLIEARKDRAASTAFGMRLRTLRDRVFTVDVNGTTRTFTVRRPNEKRNNATLFYLEAKVSASAVQAWTGTDGQHVTTYVDPFTKTTVQATKGEEDQP